MTETIEDVFDGTLRHEIMERVLRLAHTPGILGAFLLYDAVVVGGQCSPVLNENLTVRALHNLAFICYDAESQLPESKSKNPGAHVVVQNLRFVVNHLGPRETKCMLGVAVMQSEAVCKSLRRLIRQIDKMVRRALKAKTEATIMPAQDYAIPVDNLENQC